MNKKYLLLAGIIIALGIGILFMPQSDDRKQLKPDILLAAIDDQSRFLTADDITDRLVKKDPALMLIDVRLASQFNTFAIPGAINIPIDSLLSVSAQDQMNQKGMDKVFYSSSDVIADRAWIISKRIGLNRIYVLRGGVNEWFNIIVKASKPDETASAEAMELYQFRIAACQHFFGNREIATIPVAAEKKKVTVIKKPSGSKSGGGC